MKDESLKELVAKYLMINEVLIYSRKTCVDSCTMMSKCRIIPIACFVDFRSLTTTQSRGAFAKH